jgi:hypothetical protein
MTLNIVATVCMMRSDVYTASQKMLQLALVWLVPLIGSVLTLSVWAHDRKSASRDPDRHGEESWPASIGGPESDRPNRGDGFGGSSHDGHGGDGGGSGH